MYHFLDFEKPISILEGKIEKKRLAFDHNDILRDAVNLFAKQIMTEPLAFSLCEKEFTLAEVRGVYQAFWDISYGFNKSDYGVSNVPPFSYYEFENNELRFYPNLRKNSYFKSFLKEHILYNFYSLDYLKNLILTIKRKQILTNIKNTENSENKKFKTNDSKSIDSNLDQKTAKYKKSHGEKTVVLMQCGSFFEVYGIFSLILMSFFISSNEDFEIFSSFSFLKNH